MKIDFSHFKNLDVFILCAHRVCGVCACACVCRSQKPWEGIGCLPYSFETGLLLEFSVSEFIWQDWMSASSKDPPGFPCDPSLLGLGAHATVPSFVCLFVCLFNVGAGTQTQVFIQVPLYQTKILI
jgi:hypothetical protein